MVGRRIPVFCKAGFKGTAAVRLWPSEFEPANDEADERLPTTSVCGCANLLSGIK